MVYLHARDERDTQRARGPAERPDDRSDNHTGDGT
jgi:hypothetical protein